jgi:hypothetical protein
MDEQNEPAAPESVRPLVKWVVPDKKPSGPDRAHGRRDALIGGLILVALGTMAALRGGWQIFLAPDLVDAELNGLMVLGGQFLLVLAAILVALGALAARGGRRARFAVGVVGVVFGALIFPAFGLPAQPASLPLAVLLALPFFASAYFLLRRYRDWWPSAPA